MATSPPDLGAATIEMLALPEMIEELPVADDGNAFESLAAVARLAKRSANFMAFLATIDPETLIMSVVQQVDEDYNLTALETEVAARAVLVTYNAIVGGAQDVVTLS